MSIDFEKIKECNTMVEAYATDMAKACRGDRICTECGTPYDSRDETRLDGVPLDRCVPCAEDYLAPNAPFAYWE